MGSKLHYALDGFYRRIVRLRAQTSWPTEPLQSPTPRSSMWRQRHPLRSRCSQRRARRLRESKPITALRRGLRCWSALQAAAPFDNHELLRFFINFRTYSRFGKSFSNKQSLRVLRSASRNAMAQPPTRTVTAAGIDLIVVELYDRRQGPANPLLEWCFQSELENYLYLSTRTGRREAPSSTSSPVLGRTDSPSACVGRQ